ncbi:MAG TPA: efflux transporter outer membrane subunit [Rhabdochlamydiaceae bacterium]|jgi:NodT family efflux transporter outer membrane factor (OMF) lipoprotein|nr:efflux transporter outer membrane subunit [Rhabdochlamydiaceae bacterium]
MKKIWLTAVLAGCAVGPNYQAPENTITDTWSSEYSSDAPLVQWWNVFEDTLLTKYIEMASEYNNDVLTATSTILIARALRQIAASSFFPIIGADVNATKTYFSKNGPLFASQPSVGNLPGTISPVTGLSLNPQFPQVQPLYNALFDAKWEIDLFGKTRRTVEAAEALIGVTIEQRSDVLLSVMAEIARNYMELRSSQQRAKLIEENIGILEKQAVLIHKQYKAGYASLLEDENIRAILASERAVLPDIEAQIFRNIYTLSVLIGATPETLVEELKVPQPLPKALDTVAVGLRSDLLRRRPDIRRVERSLAAATAGEGIAVAKFFPTITLIGDGGLQSLMLKNLFNWGSKTWALGGDIMMPVFEGGRLIGNLKAARAETAATAHKYQQTVLNALEEAESALITFTQDLKTCKERRQATDRYQDLVVLSEQRNAKGLVSLLSVLDAQRQLNESQQGTLKSDTTKLLDLVVLFKALGGGWESAYCE